MLILPLNQCNKKNWRELPLGGYPTDVGRSQSSRQLSYCRWRPARPRRRPARQACFEAAGSPEGGLLAGSLARPKAASSPGFALRRPLARRRPARLGRPPRPKAASSCLEARLNGRPARRKAASSPQSGSPAGGQLALGGRLARRRPPKAAARSCLPMFFFPFLRHLLLCFLQSLRRTLVKQNLLLLFLSLSPFFPAWPLF